MALNFSISDEIANRIIKTKDCFAITLLLQDHNHIAAVVDFANTIIAEGDLYLLDEFWLLLYQLFLDGHIGNPYISVGSDAYRHHKTNRETEADAMAREKVVFEKLKVNQVSFVRFERIAASSPAAIAVSFAIQV